MADPTQPNSNAPADLLSLVRARTAFDPAPSRADLHELHVPYDDMTGLRSCEQSLRAALDRGERIALVGGSGSGKSSVTSWVLGPLVEGLVPLTIPISPERPQVATDPIAFAEHIMATVRARVAESMPGKGPAKRAGASRAKKFSVGAGMFGFNGSLSYELGEVTKQTYRSDEILDGAREILRVIESHHLRPVLVLDDTDKWISSAWSPASNPERRHGFFGTVVRVIAEELGAAAVVAVHPTYLDDEAYQTARGFLATTITLPRLPGPEAVRSILTKRAALTLADTFTEVPDGVDTLVDDDAVELLFTHYQHSPHGDVRKHVLLVAHAALADAADSGHATISRTVMESAISELSDL